MPIDSVIKISGTGDVNATTNDVASIDIPEDSLIVGVYGLITGAGMATEDLAQAEISFLSTNQIGVNDARGSIMEVSVMTNTVTTSGQAQASSELFMSLPDGIPAAAGERVHLHTFGSAGVTPSATFTLYLVTTPGTGRRATRRR